MRKTALVATVVVLVVTFPQQSFAQAMKAKTYTNPFAYCAAVGTVGRPGPRYRGPTAPREVLRALSAEVPNPSPSMTTWRCENGQVKACYLGASGRACEKKDVSRVPSSYMTAFCRTNPGTDVAYSISGDSAYDWRCRGRTPEIVGGSPVDTSGYYQSSWIVVSGPPGGDTVNVQMGTQRSVNQEGTCQVIFRDRDVTSTMKPSVPFSQKHVLEDALPGLRRDFPRASFTLTCSEANPMTSYASPMSRPSSGSQEIQLDVTSGPVCQIISTDGGAPINTGAAVPMSQQKRLEAQLPAMRRKYPRRAIDIACEGGE